MKGINIEHTRAYYVALPESELCGCAYCRRYRREARAALPAIAAYLDSLGVDIAKPLEAIPLCENADGTMDFIGEQYALIGTADGFTETEIGGVRISVTDAHPQTGITEPHFVIELGPVRLPRQGEAE
ncbi:MAG: hypothetical protein IKI59_08975 [Clostridia bacterium]|nr:hypothetical protein [Clostridia bacterium]